MCLLLPFLGNMLENATSAVGHEPFTQARVLMTSLTTESLSRVLRSFVPRCTTTNSALEILLERAICSPSLSLGNIHILSMRNLFLRRNFFVHWNIYSSTEASFSRLKGRYICDSSGCIHPRYPGTHVIASLVTDEGLQTTRAGFRRPQLF